MLRVRRPQDAASGATHPGTVADPTAARTPRQLDESRAFHWLFLSLNDRYEAYCRRSGTEVSPALRAAASRFPQERSLASLISFADCLDELDIPASAGGRKR